MNLIRYLFTSIICTILDVIFVYVLMGIELNNIICYKYDSVIMNAIVTGFYISVIIYILITIIAMAIKSIQCIILFFYYGLFYKDKRESIVLRIGDDNLIHESFVELKNGKIIPIYVQKIIMKNPNNDNSIGEENKNEE